MKYPKDGVSFSSKPLVQYLYTKINNKKFHRTVIIISTDGRTSDLQKECSLTRGLETAWSERGGGWGKSDFFHKVINCWFYSFVGR